MREMVSLLIPLFKVDWEIASPNSSMAMGMVCISVWYYCTSHNTILQGM